MNITHIKNSTLQIQRLEARLEDKNMKLNRKTIVITVHGQKLSNLIKYCCLYNIS